MFYAFFNDTANKDICVLFDNLNIIDGALYKCTMELFWHRTHAIILQGHSVKVFLKNGTIRGKVT